MAESSGNIVHLELGGLAASIRLAKDDVTALTRLTEFLDKNPVGKRIAALAETPELSHVDALHAIWANILRHMSPEEIKRLRADLEKYEPKVAPEPPTSAGPMYSHDKHGCMFGDYP